jgi:hypothetical protein
LGRVDDFIAIAEATANQGNVTVGFPCGGYDLRRSSIGINHEVALARRAYLLTAIQREYHPQSPLLDHTPVASLATLGGDAVNGSGRMGFDVCPLFIDERRRLLLLEIAVVHVT